MPHNPLHPGDTPEKNDACDKELSPKIDPFSTGLAVIEQTLHTLSSQSGVYRMVGEKGEALYIGKAKNLKKRVVSYTKIDQLPLRLRRMVRQTRSMEIVVTATEVEALLLENNLIKKCRPIYNILLKDDKSFPYILIPQDHSFPRIIKHRGPKTIQGDYFGPFASVAAMEEAILTLQKLFGLRPCSDYYFQTRKRPCLQYHIKRCSAPCSGYINQDTYNDNLSCAKNFLKGKTDQVQQLLAATMEEASDNLDFEKAAIIRDRIRLLTQIQTKQRINVSGIDDGDIVAIAQIGNHTCVQIFFFRYGQNFGTHAYFLTHVSDQTLGSQLGTFLMQFYQEKEPAPVILLNEEPTEMLLIRQSLEEHFNKKLLIEIPKRGIKKELVDHAHTNAVESIQRIMHEQEQQEIMFQNLGQSFNLDASKINRIEIYDNSHLQGTNAFGVMVVATRDGFDKKLYRKFSIKYFQSNDDLAMMREVIYRRFAHEKDWLQPDLLLIDGGAQQVQAVQRCLDELEIVIPVIGIAKGKERNAGQERFFLPSQKEPVLLDPKSPLMYFLQRIRDEAHRFAITTHRSARIKKLKQSTLDEVEGIGPKRKRILLQHFGSAKMVEGASIEDLMRISGINKQVAQKIYAHFHEH